MKQKEHSWRKISVIILTLIELEGAFWYACQYLEGADCIQIL